MLQKEDIISFSTLSLYEDFPFKQIIIYMTMRDVSINTMAVLYLIQERFFSCNDFSREQLYTLLRDEDQSFSYHTVTTMGVPFNTLSFVAPCLL